MIDIEKFRNIPFKTRKKCVICNSQLFPIISLPNFPLTEIYVEEKVDEKVYGKVEKEKTGFVNQEFYFCTNCGHGQLGNVIKQEFLYADKSYATRTSTSRSAIFALDIFLEFIERIIKNRKDKKIKTIIDIGCNDLYALKKLRDRAEKLYGIDPILKILKEKGEIEEDEKIQVIGDFVENVDFEKLGEMDVVLSSHTLEHIEEPKKLIKLLIEKAGEKTIFFFQFPCLESLVQDARFEQVFHQHLNYFSLKSVIYMLDEINAELINFKVNPYHWGTLMIAFKKADKNEGKENNKKFQNSVMEITEEQILKQYELFKENMKIADKRIKSAISLKEKIYCYGATPMFPILAYYIKSLSKIKYILDDDKNKEGLYFINTPLQIIKPEKIENIKNSVIAVTGITSKYALRQIISKLIELQVKDIIIPTNLM